MRLNQLPWVIIMHVPSWVGLLLLILLTLKFRALHENLEVTDLYYILYKLISFFLRANTYFKPSLSLLFFYSIILDKSYKINLELLNRGKGVLFQLHFGTDVASSLWNHYHFYLWELEIELLLCLELPTKISFKDEGLSFYPIQSRANIEAEHSESSSSFCGHSA